MAKRGIERQLLTDELLEAFGRRAGEYDRQNRFFFEDLNDLAAIGYPRIAVPEAFGGHGFTLPEVLNEQRRLAYRAPATALALNMHLYWTGAAADISKAGDNSADWILDETAAGRIFASGHGEPGNDAGIANSLTRAEPRADGGYSFIGRKIFTSLSPVWDWLGVHGLDNSDPSNPRIVHAFIKRSAAGHRTVQTWDALGMRATRSDDTLLDGAISEAAHVLRVLPAGPPVDNYIASILGWALPIISAVYVGIAERAFDLAIDGARSRKSLVLGGNPIAGHALVQDKVASAAIQLDAIRNHVERIALDWADGVDHGPKWAAKLFAAKVNAVEGARTVVDLAMNIDGAGSLAKRNELERLYRDVRAGGFHPPSANTASEVIGRTYLNAPANTQTASKVESPSANGSVPEELPTLSQ
jgi:alkylation response protein AidB-like acyl-CoA dehydrogenase